MINGWNTWDLGVEIKDVKDAREQIEIIKQESKAAKKEAARKAKEEAKYKGKTEEEIVVIKRSKEVFDLNKADQVNMLMSLGLSSAEIKALKYEQDRVDKIIELENKKKK